MSSSKTSQHAGTSESAAECCRGTAGRWLQLLLAVQCILIIWLVILPAIQQLKPIKRHLRLLEEKRIDASALYYTDLEVMDEIYPTGEEDYSRPWRKR